jgi:hypothetical protein
MTVSMAASEVPVKSLSQFIERVRTQARILEPSQALRNFGFGEKVGVMDLESFVLSFIGHIARWSWSYAYI